MTSGVTLSSMSLIRSPQCPLITPLPDPLFLTHFPLRYQQKFHGAFIRVKNCYQFSQNFQHRSTVGKHTGVEYKLQPNSPTINTQLKQILKILHTLAQS